LETLAGTFWAFCGGLLVASRSWLVWGSLFHRFGRCPNQDDFLEEFVFQSAPKLVLVTLAPFGPPAGDYFDGLAPQIRVFTADL
jgi:hypothetical protein